MNNDAQIARDTAKADLERQERQVILLCYFYGSRQDCSTSIANALEFFFLPNACIKPLKLSDAGMRQ